MSTNARPGFHHPLIRSMMELYQGGTGFTMKTLGKDHVLLITPRHGPIVVHRGWLDFAFYQGLKEKYGLERDDIEALKPKRREKK